MAFRVVKVTEAAYKKLSFSGTLGALVHFRVKCSTFYSTHTYLISVVAR